MPKYDDLLSDDDALPALTGRAWVFGDRLSRQDILADVYLAQPAERARGALMAAVDPEFSSRVARGDFVVAGHEFAADVTQRVIPAALKVLGIAAVIARSFGHFFVRNAVNVGLPAVVVEETRAIRAGDRLRVDVEARVVANLSSGDRYVIRNLEDEALAVLRAGGIVEYSRRK